MPASLPSLKMAKRLQALYTEWETALEDYDAERRRPGTSWPRWAHLSVVAGLRRALCIQAWRTATRTLSNEDLAALGIADDMDSAESGALIMEAWQQGRIYSPGPKKCGWPKGRPRKIRGV